MNENDALTALRSATAKLDQHEKLALATYLTGTSNPKFQGLVIPDMDKLTPQLAEACELSAIFPTATRIFFAIELLELQIDRDEFEEEAANGIDSEDDCDEDKGDELPNLGDYKGEGYYSSGRPLLKYWGSGDIEHFPDRRLDL